MKSSIISAIVALAAFAKTPAEVPKEHRYPDAAQGGLAFADEWKALVKLDEGDRFGWKLRFEAGTGIDWIKKATKFRTDGVLVSADAMLRTSSTSRWERPASYPLGLDALPLSGNAFHTDKEKEPWAMVVLAGECRVRGVLVANPGGCRGRQPPIEVQLSGDGKEWRTVFSDDAVRTEYRVDLGDKSVVAKFVRVRRVPGAREDFFHLNKILVYGDRMY